jgi:hypothetical protein
MKVQEIFQSTFKLITIVGQVLYLRRQTVEQYVSFWYTDNLDVGRCRFDLYLVLMLCISEFTLK